MTTLALLSAEYRAAALTLADLDLPPEVVRDSLESISGDLETKAQNVALMVRSLEADAAAIKQWARDANERASALLNRADSLRDYLAHCMELCALERISGPGVALSFRKSTAVVINEPALIPSQYMRQPETPPAVPDKVALAAALKLGEVPGAHLEHRRALQIK